MAKKPGLPGGELELAVDEGAFGAPAHVPDYLDRTFGDAGAAGAAPRTAPAPEAKRKPQPSPPREPDQREPSKVVELDRARQKHESERRPASDRRPSPTSRRAERKELSIDVETARMIDRVVAELRESTPQKDATASEFARAIIQLAEESRRHQDFTHVGRRGQWGSATARAFVADLKDGFLRAIGRRFIERYPNDARDYLRELTSEDEDSK